MKKLLTVVLLVGTSGCEIPPGLAQNLVWGLGGMISSVFQNGNLSGLGAYLSGAAVNWLIYGHQ